MAKPRVFVSSTYYDLKYVRERIERFISTYNLEPILFENNDVYFHPNKPLDKSCYQEVQTCQMMILIIGGRYGSLATPEKIKEYEKKHVSITEQEFHTSVEKGIPVMVFIDKNVFADYRTYTHNKQSIDQDFKFAHVDSHDIFNFIEKVSNQAVKIFDKIEDIELYLSSQISGMLYEYLILLQTKKEEEKINNAVQELREVSKSMQDMLYRVAEEVLKDKYKSALDEQYRLVIDMFFDTFDDDFSIYLTLEDEDIHIDQSIQIINETILNTLLIQEILSNPNTHLQRLEYSKLVHECINQITSILPNSEVRIKENKWFNKVSRLVNIFEREYDVKAYFDTKLKSKIEENRLPF